MAKVHPSKTRKHVRLIRRRFLVMFALVILAATYMYATRPIKIAHVPSGHLAANPTSPAPHAGDVIAVDATQRFTPEQTVALVHENYGATTPVIKAGIEKISFHYRSELPTGKLVTVYGRAYLPTDGTTALPIFAFAPGTTGIGDQCAASLEQPAKANWANYDSHMAAYASQGYAGVTTDYEGMRDPDRIHHYMVGELEGRALLDVVRALKDLPQAKGRLNTRDVFVSGYSQGGHAAFWADKIAAGYAPDVQLVGVVGFGPVMSVKQTLVDVVHGANINWFGPNVIYSYGDYYHKTYANVVLPARGDANLAANVTTHCIDTDLPFWGYSPAAVYTPQFIESARSNTLAELYPDLNQALEANEVGAPTTSSAKRINQGAQDNVVLATQQTALVPALCLAKGGPFQYVQYPNTTHYTTMVHSLNDTLAWMKAVAAREPVVSTCQ